MAFKVFSDIAGGNLERKMNSLLENGLAVIQVIMEGMRGTTYFYTVIATEIPGHPIAKKEEVKDVPTNS